MDQTHANLVGLACIMHVKSPLDILQMDKDANVWETMKLDQETWVMTDLFVFGYTPVPNLGSL